MDKIKKTKPMKHHIHVRVGDEFHTIGHTGDFVEFTTLVELLDKIITNNHDKVFHNV